MWLLFNLLTFHFAGTFDSVPLLLIGLSYIHLPLFLTGLEPVWYIVLDGFFVSENGISFLTRYLTRQGCSIRPQFPYSILYVLSKIWCRFVGWILFISEQAKIKTQCNVNVQFNWMNRNCFDWIKFSVSENYLLFFESVLHTSLSSSFIRTIFLFIRVHYIPKVIFIQFMENFNFLTSFHILI